MRDLTIPFNVSLPYPWPVAKDVMRSQQIIDGVKIQVFFTTAGRMMVVAQTTDGLIKISAQTPQIKPQGDGSAIALLLLTLSKTGAIELRLDGTTVSEDSPPYILQARPDPQRAKPKFTTKDKAGIKAEMGRRAQRARSYRRDGITLEQIQQRWDDLGRECRLLSKAMERLRAGDEDEVVNVSNHLRKIIGGGAGNHVLQDCAALDEGELLVWTRPPADPNLWTPAHLGLEFLTYWSSDPFATEAVGMLTYQTDLDCWLANEGGVLAGKKLTNLGKLHAIADKIGAHLDIRNREAVAVLQSMEFDGATALARYLYALAEGVLIVAMRLVQRHRERTVPVAG